MSRTAFLADDGVTIQRGIALILADPMRTREAPATWVREEIDRIKSSIK
jgi:hypothetical protein